MAAEVRSLSHGPLVVVADDPAVLASAQRVATLAGRAVATVPVASLPAAWAGAAGVVIDLHSLAAMAATLPRRAGVLVVTAAEPDVAAWRRAAAVGAETVLHLPDDERALLDRLLTMSAPPASATVVACLPARGGAGASTLAAALALAAAGHRRSILVDADPASAGLDLLLGIESVDGSRWPAFAGVRGTLPPESLAALPTAAGAAVLSHAAAAEPVAAAAFSAVLDAARRLHDLVVIDLPPGDVGGLLPPGAVVLVVVPAEVRAVTAATAAVTALRGGGLEVRLVVRAPGPGDLRARHVAEAVGAAVATEWRWQRRFDADVDAGRFLAVWRRSTAAKAAVAVLAKLASKVDR